MKLVSRYPSRLFNAFKRYPVELSSGCGTRVTDSQGRNFLDLIAGLGSCPLGHGHPAFVRAVREQSGRLTNTSNLFYTENQLALAEELTSLAGMEKCFFSNSGTEANEAALKLAMAATGRHEFIACEGGFHGRTLGSLSLTHNPAYKKKFGELRPKSSFVRFGDVTQLAKAFSERTAAFIVEPIQGESGVIVPPKGYLEEVSSACKEAGVLLILDEVQTGCGRTGSFFNYLSHYLQPDIVTTAKGLANGLPIGATLAKGIDFEPGDHGSTFGGNAFVSGVSLAVVHAILSGKLMRNASEKGGYLRTRIEGMHKQQVVEVRGEGLMLGIRLNGNAGDAVAAFRENGVLVNAASHDTLRLLPALILSKSDADNFLSVFDSVVS